MRKPIFSVCIKDSPVEHLVCWGPYPVKLLGIANRVFAGPLC